MKTWSLLLLVVLSVQSFCSVIQQTLSAPLPLLQPVAADDVEDSDLYFQRAIARKPPKKNYASDVKALVAKMTLEEKVGQMTQLEIGLITKGQGDNIQIDPDKLEKAVVKYGAGSILNVKTRH